MQWAPIGLQKACCQKSKKDDAARELGSQYDQLAQAPRKPPRVGLAEPPLNCEEGSPVAALHLVSDVPDPWTPLSLSVGHIWGQHAIVLGAFGLRGCKSIILRPGLARGGDRPPQA